MNEKTKKLYRIRQEMLRKKLDAYTFKLEDFKKQLESIRRKKNSSAIKQVKLNLKAAIERYETRVLLINKDLSTYNEAFENDLSFSELRDRNKKQKQIIKEVKE